MRLQAFSFYCSNQIRSRSFAFTNCWNQTRSPQVPSGWHCADNALNADVTCVFRRIGSWHLFFSCCCLGVCAVDCIHADLLPHDMVCCCCCTHDEISCGVRAVDCNGTDHLPHDVTSEVQQKQCSNHHCLISDPLLPLLNSTLQEETDWWLIDSGR